MIMLMDFFIAGSETMSKTLAWACLLLVKNPEVLRRVHEELDEVLGHNDMVCQSDRRNLPFTEATLMEISRFQKLTKQSVKKLKGFCRIGPVGPVAAVRSVSEDIQVGQYVLEKGRN